MSADFTGQDGHLKGVLEELIEDGRTEVTTRLGEV